LDHPATITHFQGHRGTLKESLATEVEVRDRHELCLHLAGICSPIVFSDDDVEIKILRL
jgi:hypothetical protein